MRYLLILFCGILIFQNISTGQEGFPSYYSQMDFLMASPGALRYGLYGYDNPAVLTFLHQPDIFLTWSDAGGDWNDFNRWGLFTAVPHLGFGLIHQKVGALSVTDYRISIGMGDKAASVGLSWGWSGGDARYFDRTDVLTLGTLIRPSRYVSFGIVGWVATVGEGKGGFFDLAVRPLGSELVTVFADCAFRNNYQLKNLPWSIGVAVEALPGIRLTGRYFDTKSFAVGVQLSLGRLGFSSQAIYDEDAHHSYNTYGIRIGAYDRTLLGTKILPHKEYVDYNMNGRLKYQRFKWLDGSNTLSGALRSIKIAEMDESIVGLAINTSGMVADREMLWELREQIKVFKASGKKVVIFIDRPNIDMCHFASVADKVVMDPLGTMTLEGYIMGRTFMKGLLAKLGLGYDEWRFFKYKSANESLSRNRMSDADREQRQKIINQYYESAKSDICAGREISPERFDQLVNDKVIFLPEEAIKEGLIDTIARWDAVSKIFNNMGCSGLSAIAPGAMVSRKVSACDEWGEKPRIAVVYALGACAMDEGIKARSLSKVIEAVANDKRVKGVVLRVDSPGGDAMASDYVAEAVKKCREKKPVIVSQGYVAASGGYWISMYGDKIVASPITISGSIGVIGGWIYNNGLKDTLGFSTDHVKVGKHADLGFGFTMPYLNIGVPDRNLTEEERSIMETEIRSMYQTFVAKVASGREKTAAEIEAIAQGRVWSGVDAKENGLVDDLGGLEKSIAIAKELARIPVHDKVTVVEYPEPGLLDFSMFMPKILPFSLEDDPVLKHIKFRLEHNGKPMPVLPLDDVEINGN
jgi:protease-4